MYCSTCGADIAPGLSYCNHCGTKMGVTKGRGTPSEFFPESLVWAIVTVFIVGLGCIIGLMAVMKNVLDFGESLIIAFTSLSFALVLGVEGVLIWLLLRQTRAAKRAEEAERRLEAQATKGVGPVQTRMLSEPESVISDPVTRAFEPVYRAPESK